MTTIGKKSAAEKKKLITQRQRAAKERRDRKELREKHKREHKLGFRHMGSPIVPPTKTKRKWTPSKDKSNQHIEETTQQYSLTVFEPVYTGTGTGTRGS